MRSIKGRALVAAVALAAAASPPSAAIAEDLSYYTKKKNWLDTLVASLYARDHPGEVPATSAGRPAAPAGTFTPVKTGTINGGQDPVRIATSVAGAKDLVLVVTDGGNGIGCDHAVWANAKLVTADGKTVWLDSLKPVRAKVGWSHLEAKSNDTRNPAVIGSAKFPRYIFAHAPSVVHYRIGGKYARFEAVVGIDQRRHRKAGTVEFLVTNKTKYARGATAVRGGRDRKTHPIWNRLKEDFPVARFQVRAAEEWLIRDGLAIDDGPETFKETAVAVLEQTQTILELIRKKDADRPTLAKWLGTFRSMVEKDEVADWRDLYLKAHMLRREMAFSHPDMAFEKLLVNLQAPPQYSHQCDQYLGRHQLTSPGLAVLTDWKTAPTADIILDGKLPPGACQHPDLSYDAKTILFAFSDHTEKDRKKRRFWIYECAADGSRVRQLTGTRNDPLAAWDGRRTVLIEDWDPCYLPGGGFIFISTRCQSFGRCHGSRYTPSFMLYRANSDGSRIRQAAFGEANEWEPSVLADGRVIYCRWDYINRNDTHLQSLWTTRPDGTDVRHYYGNHTRKPTMFNEARQIPGTRKVVATAMAHHSYTTGSIIVVDRSTGEDGQEGITRITPEAKWPEAEGFRPQSYCNPWPINEDMFLAAYQPDTVARQGRRQREDAYAIFYVDRFGGREFIYHHEGTSATCPIPLRPRPKPRAIPNRLPPDGVKKNLPGIAFVKDVNICRHKLPDKIVAIRVNQIINQPTRSKRQPGSVQNEILKKTLGTVAVNPDGSVMFAVPAGVPIQFQGLDGNGMAIHTMRSMTYFHPGESQSCIGCHEPAGTSMRAPKRLAGGTPKKLTPPPGLQKEWEWGLSFTRDVQPVLDRYCIRCHGLKGECPAGVNLLGEMTRGKAPHGGAREGTKAYFSLVCRKGMVTVAPRNREKDISTPKDYFSHAGKLAHMLLEGHTDKNGTPRVNLDGDSLQRIVNWLDLNAQCYGKFSHNYREDRKVSKDGEKALRAFVRKTFGDDLAAEPLGALVNCGEETASRILKAPLSRGAGGWGQISGGWSSTADPGYKKALDLVKGVFEPMKRQDICGTCGSFKYGGRCRCGCCWIHETREEYRTRYAAGDAEKDTMASSGE